MMGDSVPPRDVDLRKDITMEFRIADIRLLIAALRKSSIKDDRNRDWRSTGNVEEPKNALLLDMHP